MEVDSVNNDILTARSALLLPAIENYILDNNGVPVIYWYQHH